MGVRLLHTADWHLGRSIRGRSRNDEFTAVLGELTAIAERERVDAVLLAGDIYDTRAPSPEADAQFFGTCLRLREMGITVVAIPGNHDSAVRFAALAPLLAAVGVTVVPHVAPVDQGTAVTVRARDNSAEAVISCVPFVPERRFGTALALLSAPEDWYRSYQEGVGGVFRAMAGAFRDDAVNVLMAHVYTSGALLGGGEREVNIGVEYAISPAQFPGEATYVALGHLHRPQAVSGSAAPARYAGSLLQLDFGEAEQAKSVAIVEAAPGRPAAVRTVSLTTGRPLVDVRGTLDEVIDAGRARSDAWLRCFVTCDGPTPGLSDRIRSELPDALEVRLEYERQVRRSDGAAVGVMTPRDQFLAYFQAHHGAEPTAELVGAFEDLLSVVVEEG